MFLDEIGDMPYEVQAVLLRVLENHQVMRIGGDKYIDVEFRLVAATNQDLQELVRKRLFREDLYYRLSALKIVIPPLKERDDDVVLLAEHFIQEYCGKMQWQVPRLSSEAKSILLHGDWPGNVRQLQKAVVYAVTTGNGEWIVPGNFPDDVFSTSIAPSKALISPDPIRDAEIETIQKALTATDHDVAQAAKMLNMGKSTLYKKIKKYQLR